MIRVHTESFKRMCALYEREVIDLSDRENERSARAMVRLMRRHVPVRSGTLRSTIVAEPLKAVGNRLNGWGVYAGGPKTERKIGNRTYERVIRIGSGDTAGARKKAGGENVVYDYARLVEFGTKFMDDQAYMRPSRNRVRRQHSSRVRRGLRKIARDISPRA
ncbi:hypothetical protein [Brevundimonas sp.]|uniref:hypothetical protein n=1 Tax=Brevundimonas sp. TaxID=1871086 RepID=UPI0035B39D6C